MLSLLFATIRPRDLIQRRPDVLGTVQKKHKSVSAALAAYIYIDKKERRENIL